MIPKEKAMNRFAVYKNGRLPIRKEFNKFISQYLGIDREATNLLFYWEYKHPNHGISDDDRIKYIETDILTESEWDQYSIDWEFIDITPKRN